MNIGYLIGLVVAIGVMVLGMANGFPPYEFEKIGNFGDGPSVMIVIGCTVFILMASFPLKTFLSIPKHFGVMMKNPKQKPENIINSLVDLAQTGCAPPWKTTLSACLTGTTRRRPCMTRPRPLRRLSAWWAP